MDKEKILDHINKDDKKNKIKKLKRDHKFSFFGQYCQQHMALEPKQTSDEIQAHLVFLKHARPRFSHVRQLSPCAFLKSHLESF